LFWQEAQASVLDPDQETPMATFRLKATRLLRLAGLCGLVAAFGPGPASGQTPDPYRPYNSAYDAFVYPTYPNGTGFFPNQGMVQGNTGLSQANQFEDFMNDVGAGSRFEDDRSPGPRRTGPGVPYYAAYRRYDRDYDRVYQPNKKSDPDYYDEQRARHEKYLDYLKEKNPAKRAQLYREYMTETRRANLGLAAPSPSGGAARGTNTAADLFGSPSRGATRRGSSAGTFGSGSATGSSLLDLPGTARSSSTSSVEEILKRSRSLDPARRGSTTKPSTRGTPSTDPLPR
jgi:hypothetical protein